MVKTIVLDCTRLRDKDQAHDYLARTLQLPDYYGRNLDALYDCLTEVGPCTLVLTGAEALRQEHGYGEKLLDTLADAARDAPSLRIVYNEDAPPPDRPLRLGGGRRGPAGDLCALCGHARHL